MKPERQLGDTKPTLKQSKEPRDCILHVEQQLVSSDGPPQSMGLHEHAHTIGHKRARNIGRHLTNLAGLSSPEQPGKTYENLGNRELPVYKEKKNIQDMIRNHQISMIEGPTGSGKSTQIAQYALEMGFKKIIYLEPRVLLADNLSDRIQYELGEQIGAEAAEELIGVRHSESSTGRGKVVEVMTPDTSLRVYEELEKYADEDVLIVGDEIHEKDFASELAAAVIASELEIHPKWRLALMSATLDAPSIQQAFGDSSGKEVPLLSVEGRPFDLEIIEEPELTVTEAYELYGPEHKKALLFTAGKQEIKDFCSKLRSMKLKDTLITALHAKLSKRQINRATSTVLKNGKKQIIPCTNAAQSGITISGLTLVISDGTIRRQDIDQDGTEGLFKVYCAEDEMIQQAGRGGRDTPGAVFINCKPDDPNFKFVPMSQRKKHAPAQIYHMNIANNVLAVAALGRDFNELNERWLVNKVEQRKVLKAYEVLYRLGALDENNQITDLGKQMNKFPVRPELARALVEAVNTGADAGQIRQLVAMISCVGAGGLPYFEKGIGQAWRDDIRKETKDDYTAQLDMFLATREFYDGQDVDENELQKRNYDLKNTRRAHRTYDKICRKLGYSPGDLPEAPTSDELTELQDYLTAGLFDHVYRRVEPDAANRKGTYVSMHGSEAGTAQQRELSNRGTYKGNDPLVLGFARNFEVHTHDRLEGRSTVENVIPTTQRALAAAALRLAEYVPQAPTIRGGRLQQRVFKQFGDVVLGEGTSSNANFMHTPESKKLLIDEAFAKSTQTISEIVKIKKRLEWLSRRTPKADASKYFPSGTLTQDWLLQKLESVITDDVDDIYKLDYALSEKVITHEGISLQTWITEAHEQEILERSPDIIHLQDGTPYTLYYANGGEPIVKSFKLRDVESLPSGDHWYLPDGREIHISYAIGNNTKQWDIGTIRRFARGELRT